VSQSCPLETTICPFQIAPVHSKLPRNMSRNPLTTGTIECTDKIRGIGRLAVGINVCMMFAILIFDYQSGGHGEMGSFYHANLPWILLFSGWGVATGIGLLRAWRWARISALIFCKLLVLFGIFGFVALLRVPGGDVFDGKVLISRAVLGLVTLIPIASGVWWLIFFNRKDVKTYFHGRR